MLLVHTTGSGRTVVFSGYSSFLRHDITEILLKVALNTITPIIHFIVFYNRCGGLKKTEIETGSCNSIDPCKYNPCDYRYR